MKEKREGTGGGRKEGFTKRKEGRKEWRNEGRMDGWKECRKEGRFN
jgi:hypothetical protein